MHISKTYEFRTPFPLCEFTVWEEFDRESLGGGGRESRAGGVKPPAQRQRLPIFFCAVLIVVLSVESYVALYAIFGALARSLGAALF